MVKGITFKEMIFTSISTNFKFWSKTIGCTLIFGFIAGLENTGGITGEIECPLVKVACCNGDEVVTVHGKMDSYTEGILCVCV